MKNNSASNIISALFLKGFLCVPGYVLSSRNARFDVFCNLGESYVQEKILQFKKGNFQSKIFFPGARQAAYNQLDNQSVNRKTASDTIHEMYLSTVKWFYIIVLASFLAGVTWIIYKAYLYFKNNAWQEIGMDAFIILLVSIVSYSAYKKVKSMIQRRRVSQ